MATASGLVPVLWRGGNGRGRSSQTRTCRFLRSPAAVGGPRGRGREGGDRLNLVQTSHSGLVCGSLTPSQRTALAVLLPKGRLRGLAPGPAHPPGEGQLSRAGAGRLLGASGRAGRGPQPAPRALGLTRCPPTPQDAGPGGLQRVPCAHHLCARDLLKHDSCLFNSGVCPHVLTHAQGGSTISAAPPARQALRQMPRGDREAPRWLQAQKSTWVAGEVPGRLPGGGSTQAVFCRMAELCEKEQAERGPHSEDRRTPQTRRGEGLRRPGLRPP